VIQGSAADLIKKVMLDIDKDLVLRQLRCTMLLQVHDELIFELPDIDCVVQEAKNRIVQLMTTPFEQPLRVPLTVGIDDGYNWGDAK
jgi:DNA polymerase-1